MTDFVLLLLVGSLWIWGVFCLFSEGYLLHFIASKAEKDGVPRWITKPAFGCPPCMSSLHGLIIGLPTFGLSAQALLFIVCLCGLNFIIKSWLYPEYE